MWQFFCDTNCELWYTRAEELGVKVIKMPYFIEDEEYFYDLGKNTDFKSFYSKVRSGIMPKTSALNEFNYIDYFEPILKDGKDILYVTFSHKLSATFNQMDKAIITLKEKYPERKIEIFDTKSISLGAGIQVEYSAKLWKEGKSIDEVVAFLSKFTKEIGTYFVVDNLKHLLKGGRINNTQAVFGSLLGIKPLLKINTEGALQNISKIKGAKKVISELTKIVLENKGDVENYAIYVVHADCEEFGQELVAKLKEILGEKVEIRLQIVGPVIGTHCGGGTLGVIFHAKNR